MLTVRRLGWVLVVTQRTGEARITTDGLLTAGEVTAQPRRVAGVATGLARRRPAALRAVPSQAVRPLL
ncbi:hypothetical protein E4P43_10925 [Blastococcus sp. TF02A-35]|nr:hypothetical protein E4P43_10925 [Blastococcus sp. TF02A_35]